LSIVYGLNFCNVAARADDADSYPHITQLETYILGKTYISDALPDRIARMETKAFGKPSTDPDLSARTDALDDYSAQKLGKRTPVAPDSDTDDTVMDTADGGSAVPAAPPTQYPHIDMLEKEILGQTYQQDALPDRIARMEQQAFGKVSSDPDLTNRTDALDEYTEKKLHKQSFDKQQAEEAKKEGYISAAGAGGVGPGATGGEKAKAVGKSVLNMLGSQLLNMAIPIPGLASSFAGIRAVPASAVNQGGSSADSGPQRPAEDPAIFESAPPPPNARMITQVGWAEMRIFGHTSPQLHISERLEQLNVELNYAPNQKGTELMDDVPKLIAAVQARSPKAQ
jgi:hypothetical protein